MSSRAGAALDTPDLEENGGGVGMSESGDYSAQPDQSYGYPDEGAEEETMPEGLVGNSHRV